MMRSVLWSRWTEGEEVIEVEEVEGGAVVELASASSACWACWAARRRRFFQMYDELKKSKSERRSAYEVVPLTFKIKKGQSERKDEPKQEIS
jgi:hypothetical protein